MPETTKTIRAITILIIAGISGFTIASVAGSLARIADRMDLMARHIEATQCIDDAAVL